MKSIVYTRSGGFSIFALAIHVLFLFGCQVIFWIAVTHSETTGLWIGAIGTVIFGWMLYLSWCEARQPFALTLDDSGIDAPTTFANIVHWKDIQAISYRTWRFHEFADISLKSNEEYIRKLPTLRRFITRMDRMSGSRHFSIRITALNAPANVVYDTIVRLWKDANK